MPPKIEMPTPHDQQQVNMKTYTRPKYHGRSKERARKRRAYHVPNAETTHGPCFNALKCGLILVALLLDEQSSFLNRTDATVACNLVGLKHLPFMECFVDSRPKNNAFLLRAGPRILANLHPSLANQLVLILCI